MIDRDGKEWPAPDVLRRAVRRLYWRAVLRRWVWVLILAAFVSLIWMMPG